MNGEHEESRLEFSAGNGEWYNQPHDERWDMVEDVAEIPPAAWHVELESAIDALTSLPSVVVVDVTEMAWLVGQDWGFLFRLSARLRDGRSRLAVVGTERVVRAGKLLELDEHLGLATTLEDALESG